MLPEFIQKLLENGVAEKFHIHSLNGSFWKRVAPGQPIKPGDAVVREYSPSKAGFILLNENDIWIEDDAKVKQGCLASELESGGIHTYRHANSPYWNEWTEITGDESIVFQGDAVTYGDNKPEKVHSMDTLDPIGFVISGYHGYCLKTVLNMSSSKDKVPRFWRKPLNQEAVKQNASKKNPLKMNKFHSEPVPLP